MNALATDLLRRLLELTATYRKNGQNIDFLELPMEIRFLIYHFLFVIDTANSQWRKYAKSKSSHDVIIEGLCDSPALERMIA